MSSPPRGDAASIFATGIDDTTAEISRFYFGNKIL